MIITAERRMFAKTIVLSDAFLDMPLSARALYMTLGMVADDDGFVNSPRSIMRQCGASVDDMNVLLAKKFILAFDDGVIVIKHWRINNYLRNDRYQATKYLEHKEHLTIQENGTYSLVDESHFGIPSMGIPSIGKDSIDKNNIDAQNASQIEGDFATFWNAYPKKKDKKKAHDAFVRIAKDGKLPQIDEILIALESNKRSADWKKSNGQYIPYPTTWLNGRRWEDEIEVKSIRNPQDFERMTEEDYKF